MYWRRTRHQPAVQDPDRETRPRPEPAGSLLPTVLRRATRPRGNARDPIAAKTSACLRWTDRSATTAAIPSAYKRPTPWWRRSKPGTRPAPLAVSSFDERETNRSCFQYRDRPETLRRSTKTYKPSRHRVRIEDVSR